MLEIVVGAYTVSDLVDGDVLGENCDGVGLAAHEAFVAALKRAQCIFAISWNYGKERWPDLSRPSAAKRGVCEVAAGRECHPTSFTFTEVWRVHRRFQASETPTGESLRADICLTCYSANWGGYYVLLFQVF